MSKSGPRDHAVASWETCFCSRNVDFPLPCQIWCFDRPMVPCCYGPPWATVMANHHHHRSNASQRPVHTNFKSQTTPIHEHTPPIQAMMLHQLKNYTNLLLHQSLLIGVARKMNWCNVRTGRITPIYYFFALV